MEPHFATPELPDPDYSEGDKLIKVAEALYQPAELQRPIMLDDWQKWVLRRVLAKRPDGQWHHRINLVSIPRQNGKSVLGALMALYFTLLHEPGPQVISLASTTQQASIVFNRLLWSINNSPTLRRRLKKATETRGIATLDGGNYRVLPSISANLQGLALSGVILDECHIVNEETFDAILIGTGQRDLSQIFIITTAGDSESTLLKRLYEMANQGDIGGYIWQADDNANFDDPEVVREQLIKANPSLADGRMSIDRAVEEWNILPRDEGLRYRMNIFTDLHEERFIEPYTWAGTLKGGVESERNLVFSVDRSADWAWVSITAHSYDPNGVHKAELVASLPDMRLEALNSVLAGLARFSPQAYVFDAQSLSAAGKRLRDQGFIVYNLTHNEIVNASSLAYARLKAGKVWVQPNDLLTAHALNAKKAKKADGYRIRKGDGDQSVESFTALVNGIFVSEMLAGKALQIFL